MNDAKFDAWWRNEGSSITPQAGEDMETFAKRVAFAAFEESHFRIDGQQLCRCPACYQIFALKEAV